MVRTLGEVLIPGELYSFPPPEEWDSIDKLLWVLNECRKLVAAGKHREVDSFWRGHFLR